MNTCLVLVQPRKTHPDITERLLMGSKESNETKTFPNTDAFMDANSIEIIMMVQCCPFITHLIITHIWI